MATNDITPFKSLDVNFQGAPMNGFGNNPDMTMDLAFNGAPFVIFPNQSLLVTGAQSGGFFVNF